IDCGYHYEPLDYFWTRRNVSASSSLLLTNGVAVAIYGTNGIILQNGSQLISEGSPLAMNRLVRYQAVQELPTTLGTTLATMSLINIPSFFSAPPNVRIRFTDISLLADVP